MNSLHIGSNSSLPAILDIFSDVFLLYNPSYQRIFKEHDYLKKITHNIKERGFVSLIKKAKLVKKIVKNKNIDLIFINRKDDMFACKLAFAFKKKRPLIFGTFHNPYVWINDKKVKLFSYAMRYCLDGHLSMASFAYNKLLKFGYPKNRIIFFQNYIKFEDFIPKSNYEIKDNVFKICYSGTIDDRKNELFSMKVILSLCEKYNIHFDIYGPFSDDNYKKKVLEFLQNPIINDKVSFYSRPSPLEERKVFVNHDLYLSASKAEMCPLNILNAKACGLPIVASNSFGQQDLIKNNIDGYLFNENDVDDASKKIETLINDLELRKRMGHEAYLSISSYNSYIKASEMLLEFINSIKKNRHLKRNNI